MIQLDLHNIKTIYICIGISNTGGLVPPCASDELSNLRFWDALNGPAWFNNATSFGHVDFFDEGAISGLIEVSASTFLDYFTFYRQYILVIFEEISILLSVISLL